jgi:hypothetical protein
MAKPEKGTIALGTSFFLPETWVRRGFRGFTPESVAQVYTADLKGLSEQKLRKMLERSPWESDPSLLTHQEKMVRSARVFQEKMGSSARITETHAPVWHTLLKKAVTARQLSNNGVADQVITQTSRLTDFFMSLSQIPREARESVELPSYMARPFFERYLSLVPYLPMNQNFLPQWGAFLYAQAYPIVTDVQNQGALSAFKNNPAIHGHEAQTLAGSCPATPLVRAYWMGWGQSLAESGIQILADGVLVLPPRLR